MRAWYNCIMPVLFAQYIQWHFVDAPRALVKGWGNILWFNANYFSVGMLLKTFFAPWKGIAWQKNRGFNIGNVIEVAFSNIISRVIGAVVRAPIILIGLAGMIGIFVVGVALLLFWFLLPMLIPGTFVYGFKLLI